MDKKILRQLNYRLIWNQFLKKPSGGKDSMVTVSDGLCGVNSQNFRDSYMSYWSRTTRFTEKKLLSSFKPNGVLSRTWTVRGTVHTFPTRDYEVHVFGSPVERYLMSHDRYARQLGVPNRQGRIAHLYEPLLDEIGKEKVTTEFVHNFLAVQLEKLGIKGKQKLERGWTSEKTMGVTWNGLYELSYLGMLSNAGRKGSGNLWTSTRHWLGRELSDQDPKVNARKLLLKYIDRYGPVTLKDIAYWTGHKVSFLTEMLSELKGEINSDTFPGSNEIYYLTEELQEYNSRSPHIIILPRFDSLIMGYSDKSRILDHRFLDRISVKAGVINPTILVNGFVQGVWRKNVKGKTMGITVELFRKVNDRDMKKISEKFSDFSSYEGMDADIRFRLPG